MIIYIDTSEFNILATNVFNAKLAKANLITKTDFDAKLSSRNRKFTQNKPKHLLVENELNTLKNEIPHVSSLVKKTDYNTKAAAIDTNISTLDGKITKNKNELEELTKGATLVFLGNIFFDEKDGNQAYLVFQPVYNYFKFITNTNYISSWKFKGLSDESIKPFPTSDNSLKPLLEYYSCNISVKLMEVF